MSISNNDLLSSLHDAQNRYELEKLHDLFRQDRLYRGR